MQKPNKQDVPMKNILAAVDRILCRYLGLDKTETIPHFVQQKGRQIMIINTDSFKRHTQKTPISKIDLEMMDKENREKLGIAIGKAIASNLVVSFDEIVIKRENIHA